MAGTTIIFDTFLAPAWYKIYQYIVDYVERTIGIPTFLINGETLDDFALAYADVGVVSRLSALQLLNQKPCAVELIAAMIQKGIAEEQTTPAFFDIVVHKDSHFLNVNDLERCIWADHPGQYREMLGTPGVDCKARKQTSSQAQSLRLVLDRQADATLINSQMLDIVLNNSSHIASQVRSLGSYSYTSGPLIVVAKHVPVEIRGQIQQAFLSIAKDPFFSCHLDEGRISGFIPISNQHYQPAPARLQLAEWAIMQNKDEELLIARRN